jgi:hypothetical protein
VAVTAASLILSACVSKPPNIVYIPVYSCPAVELPNKPIYKYEELKDTDTYDKIVKYWVASMIQCKSYAKELETILKGYNEVAKEGIFDEEKR